MKIKIKKKKKKHKNTKKLNWSMIQVCNKHANARLHRRATSMYGIKHLPTG